MTNEIMPVGQGGERAEQHNSILEAQRLGQSIWYDNIRRGLLSSGEMGRLIELGVTGVTSNPTIFEKAIAGSTDYDAALLTLARASKSVMETYEALVVDDIRATADLLRPVYDRTGGADGYASLEVSPSLAQDTEGTVEEAKRLFATLDRPNVMVKVPATSEGIPAIRRLIGEGINVNITLIFSLDAYCKVREAYIAGLEELDRSGGDVRAVASVASFFLSRVDTVVDGLLEERIRNGQEELSALLGKAAISNARLAYQAFKATFGGERFAPLRAKSARVQRPLWASTGTKNPAYSDVMYLEELIGAKTVNTVPPATLTAFLEHGRAEATLERGIYDAERAIEALAAAGLGMEQITDKLLTDGVRAFADSFDKLMGNIEEKRTRLLEREHIESVRAGQGGERAEQHVHPGVNLRAHLPDVEAAVSDLQQRDVVGRIWRKDHTVWKPEPSEIANRLGWLAVTDVMCDQAPALEAFANEIKDAGFRHVVVLGMGGSSLGPEVLRQAFLHPEHRAWSSGKPRLQVDNSADQGKKSADSYPELIVLDSIVPAWIHAVTEAIDPARTVFLVSSKSGSTIEPLSFYAHFRSLVEKELGKEGAGGNFVAITDPGTPLEKQAQEEGFRRVFLNPPDIGGRYSVLSYFGLVPAVLMGVDITALLDRADCMREGCNSCVPAHDNPGAWLGAVMGVLASKGGRNKLTLVTSPSISSFGLWVEQLIAESTGKEGTGIVPMAGEPLAAPEYYGNDRLFVYLRLEGDDNTATDATMEQIISSGQPVVRLEMRDRYDLGAEFFRWEFATAVAGSLLGIHPFDQPDVQRAKDMTDLVLQEYQRSGRLPQAEDQYSPSAGSGRALKGLLSNVRPGNYMAIMAYLRQTPELDRVLSDLRRRITERYHIATTFGYGPRFLHSTGQLHKGGPDTGLFLQLVADLSDQDLPIPGEPNTFGVLADAQALGDLQALQALGRRVVRVHLGSGSMEEDIQRLIGEMA